MILNLSPLMTVLVDGAKGLPSNPPKALNVLRDAPSENVKGIRLAKCRGTLMEIHKRWWGA